MMPLGILIISSQENAQESSIFKGLKEVGKWKERKRAAGFRCPLLFCFFSLFLLKKKARKPVFAMVREGVREGGGEDGIYHRNLCDGSRTDDISLFF